MYVTPTDTLPSYILVFNVSCSVLFSGLSAAAGREITASRHTVAIKVFIMVLSYDLVSYNFYINVS